MALHGNSNGQFSSCQASVTEGDVNTQFYNHFLIAPSNDLHLQLVQANPDFMMTQNRKRGRNHQEDETEFMPLSKRINNLHINNSLLLDSNGQTLPPEWGPGPPYIPPPGSHPMPESPPESVQSLDWTNAASYNPELTENQNPYYFNINKLLYEMYLARQQRNNN